MVQLNICSVDCPHREDLLKIPELLFILCSKPFPILYSNPLTYPILYIFPLIIYYILFPLSFNLKSFLIIYYRPFPLSFTINLSSNPLLYYSPFLILYSSVRPFHTLYSRPFPLSFTLVRPFHTLYSRRFHLFFTLVLHIPFTLDLSLYSLL